MARSSVPRSVRTARDNERARAAGYRDYYDFRTHGYGAIPPGEPVSGAALRLARGHASASDFEREVGDGSLVLVGELERGRGGRYTKVVVTVIDLEGRERNYVLRGKALTQAMLARLADAAIANGATISPTKSLDLRTIYSGGEEPEDLDEMGYGVSN